MDFILTNSKDPNESFSNSSNFVDPFTGASRYTPASNDTGTASGNSGMNLDPFTGIN